MIPEESPEEGAEELPKESSEPIPTESRILLGAIAGIWILIGAFQGLKALKARKK